MTKVALGDSLSISIQERKGSDMHTITFFPRGILVDVRTTVLP
jgi:hypothetical protein